MELSDMERDLNELADDAPPSMVLPPEQLQSIKLRMRAEYVERYNVLKAQVSLGRRIGNDEAVKAALAEAGKIVALVRGLDEMSLEELFADINGGDELPAPTPMNRAARRRM
jgi:hypothetical protein